MSGALEGRARGVLRGPDGAEYLRVGNPFTVADALRSRISRLGRAGQRRLISKVFPDVALGRVLPAAAISLVAGVIIAATTPYRPALLVDQPATALLLTYGVFGLLYNGGVRLKTRRQLLDRSEEVIEIELERIREDQRRAVALHGRSREKVGIGLDRAAVELNLALPQGEEPLLAAEGAVKARETRFGLAREAEGRLVVTSARLLFLGAEKLDEIELNRVVRVDVIDEIRLTVTLSKREPPFVCFAPGSAHEAAAVIRLARESLYG